MRIDEIELVRVEVPLVAPFRTSFGVQTHRDVLLACVRGEGVEGWGEDVAGVEPLYSSEFVEASLLALRDHLVPRLLDAPVVVPDEVGARLAPVRGWPMAKAALEAAVLDAELRLTGTSLADHLGATRRHLLVGVSVGLAATIDDTLADVDAYVRAGYRRVKLKIEPGRDVELVRAVREQVGPDVALQVDANAAYELADAEHLRRLDDFGLLLIEQPLAEDDLVDHAALASQLATPICLDESITSAKLAADALALGSCSIINIKPGRVGGLLEARRIHDLCLERGVPVWCGGMLETGIGRAANLALAALPGFTLPPDLSASDRYFRDDLTEPFVLRDGGLDVPTGPGIGVVPRPDRLAGAWRETIRAGARTPG